MVGFTFASSVLLAALTLSDATPPPPPEGTYSPTPSATYPPTASEFPTSSTYEPTLTEYPTYFETYNPTITAYPTTVIESPTITLAMAVSEARRQQNADGTKKLSLKGAATNTDDPCGQDDEDGTGTIPTSSARKGSEKRSRRQEKRSQRHAKRAAKRSAMKEKRSAKKQSRMEKRAAMKEKRSVKRATRKDDWACVAQCGKTRSDDTEKCLAECRNATSVPPEPPFEIA